MKVFLNNYLKIFTMKRLTTLFLVMMFALPLLAQNLPAKLEELTAPDFLKAVQKSDSVCVIPIGVLEKHGPHLPLGTDILAARNLVELAVFQEYAVIFPSYIFSQIFEAKHQPGTIAYSQELIWKVLQETCDELARNGFRKIVLVSWHGGNNNFLPFFCQSQLSQRRNYVVVNYTADPAAEYVEEINKAYQPEANGHAGQTETSVMLAIHPELVKQELAATQSGKDHHQIENPDGGYAGIWWFGKYPNHYAGDGSIANKEFGELLQKADVKKLAQFLKEIKQNCSLQKVQNEFYDKAENPLKTRQ
jgi:creatinine amidohydrolase